MTNGRCRMHGGKTPIKNGFRSKAFMKKKKLISTTNNEYFSASNDMEAKNEVMKIMNNNTGYRGRGCKLIELTSNKPKPQQQQSKTYEVRIQCRNNSTIDTQYFSASNDMEAENEARRIINNNTGYRGRGCEIIEMLSR